MEDLKRYVRQEVIDWIEKVQERSPDPVEVDAITSAVTNLAYDFIGKQILKATS